MNAVDLPGRGEPPIIAAAFPDERRMREAVEALGDAGVGRDFIGVLIADEAAGTVGPQSRWFVSVLAARRQHEDLASTLTRSGATAVGSVTSIRERFGHLPHPGVFDDRGLRLPMGAEYEPTPQGPPDAGRSR
jgi:hypothetical protein